MSMRRVFGGVVATGKYELILMGMYFLIFVALASSIYYFSYAMCY